MRIPFIKMHGLGNDYMYIDCFQPDTAKLIAKADLSALARKVSDRHFGIGSDGLVLILPSKVADVRMRMFNADGSEAEMCGNAARCIAKYVYEHHYCDATMTLDTLAGIKPITVHTEDGQATDITVTMGTALGNPHEVFFVDTLDELNPQFEHLLTHSNYADLRSRTNIECAYVANNKELYMRVCERGTGETMACGTGACAAATVAMNKGLTENLVIVHLRGGDLSVRRDDKGIIYLTGPATEVFCGTYNWED